MNPPTSNLPPAVVLDANVSVSVCAREPTAAKAQAEITRYLAGGAEFYAPGVLVAETLYVLCGKLQDGSLSPADHVLAVQDFDTMMRAFVHPPPGGDATLLLRAEAIRGTYTCRRSADGLYIALAEALAATRTTMLLTFDQEMSKQALRNAPSVSVHLLTP
jgi:predicted nucleic acid-binding protein